MRIFHRAIKKKDIDNESCGANSATLRDLLLELAIGILGRFPRPFAEGREDCKPAASPSATASPRSLTPNVKRLLSLVVGSIAKRTFLPCKEKKLRFSSLVLTLGIPLCVVIIKIKN